MLQLPLLVVISVVSLQGVDAIFDNYSSGRARHGSCRLRVVREIADEPAATESFVLDDIEYKLCRYHVTWDEALIFCSSHRSHLATLDTDEKTAFVVRAIASSSSVTEDYWIGGRKYYHGAWMWNSNQKKLSLERNDISKISIRYPGYETDDGHCLTIDRSGHDVPIFIPRSCNHRRPFICQRDNEPTVDNKIRMVAASRIGDQEFRLYSGKATWAEAVVQCRQEGLQIGEVNSIEEARALAITMLRNRPEAIESAWIGGYARMNDPNIWRWLASGEKIHNNGLWKKNLTESAGGCLLLDRHVCDSPVYVRTMCDRKRDVLCQKPPKRRVSKNPVAVFVEGCPYWIGFHPLKWSDAKRSCDALNASLVVLDSPKTISHMMILMLDNRAELRHIWIDGRRVRNAVHWKWDSTGERIPDFGESFIPWCPDEGFFNNETDCLNLDRENIDSPLVYGLSCHEKQTYVCQPRAGDCVFHSTTPAASTAGESAQEILKTTFTPPFYGDSGPSSPSTVTAHFPMSEDVYAIHTTIDEENDNTTDLLHWKPGESVSGANNSDNLLQITRYLKPLSHITLPSLPQFGIKVVSAAETPLTQRPIFDGKRKKMRTFQASTTLTFGVTPSLVPSTPPSIVTIDRKIPMDAQRKASKLPPTAVNATATSDFSTFVESTFPSLSIGSKPAKVPSRTANVSGQKVPSGSRNTSSKVADLTRTFTTLSPTLPEDPAVPLAPSRETRTNKYSVKTTRDLSPSNSTRIVSTATTTTTPPNPDTTRNKPTHSVRGSVSSMKDFKDIPPKPVIVESFPVNAVRPNPLQRKKQKARTTTEALPYDAIDADYYNNYGDAAVENSKGKDATEKETKGSGNASNEYSEDYDATPSARPKTKKKSKQASSTNERKGLTVTKNFRRTGIPNIQRGVEEMDKEDDDYDDDDDEDDDDDDDDDDEDEDEEEEYTEDRKGRKRPADGKSIPIAAELSKNLEAALVNMMKQSVERRINEKSESTTWRSAGGRDGNSSYHERIMKGVKSAVTENWSLRPYYAFEGPMIAGLSEDSHLGGQVERTGNVGNGRVREFKFIGNKAQEDASIKALETAKFVANETRRRMHQRDSVTPRNLLSGVSMPIIQPNDPNSLLQLGRYFKNKFVGFDADVSSNPERFDSEERKAALGNMREEQRRYGMPGPNARPRLRYRPRHVGNDDELRRNVYPRAWERPRRPMLESDSNYYEGRRLYPRGYDFYDTAMPRRRNEERRREAQDRLAVAWPSGNLSNYEMSFDEQSQAVSPRTFPAPIRTTRSFHDEPTINSAEPSEHESFPDFRLSKLVKEVKIDLDQRLLRKYLEGFATKVAKKKTGSKDDWKNTWRKLLGQMLTILGRMSVNVNGDLMKVRVGGDDRENKLTSSVRSHSDDSDWKFGSRKQRKDSINPANPKQSPYHLLKTFNESAAAGEKKLFLAKSLQAKDTPNINEEHVHGANSVTRSPIAEKFTAENDHLVQNPQSSPPLRNHLLASKFVDKGSSRAPHREERTARPIIADHRYTPRQTVISNPRKAENWYRPKYSSFNNSRILLASPPSMIPQLSTVYAYRPVMPQLHHRILFPGWTGINIVNRVKPANDNSAVSPGGDLPKGNPPKIVESEHNHEHSGNGGGGQPEGPPKYISTTAMPRIGSNNEDEKNRSDHLNGKLDEKLDRKGEHQSLNKNSLLSSNEADEGSASLEKISGRHEVRTEDPSRFLDTDDNHRGNIGEEDEITTDQDANSRQDYEQKPVWSPAHHLTKALELSLLRKFGTNPGNSLRSKNLVARSAKNEIEESLEKLNQEPSIVSLRMMMNPDETNWSRTSRQSQDSRFLQRSPRSTVDLRLEFSGEKEASDSIAKTHVETNRIPSDSWMRNQAAYRRGANRRIFIDNDQRRALLNRLRERRRKFRSNTGTFPGLGKNGTLTILPPRDRKSRKIDVSGEENNMLNNENSSEDYPVVSHHVATVLRSFDEKYPSTGGKKRWRRGPYGKELGVDWTGQAASLFTDLKENEDEFTLYIDLTLGRVGSKTRNKGRSIG